MKMLVLAIAVFGLSGCTLTQRLQAGGPSGPGYKTVSTKEEPATLVALDGSECRVTADRFERVAVGERVWCYWLVRGGVDGPPGTGPVGEPVGPPVGPDWP